MHVVLVGAEFEENLAVRYLRGALEQAGHRVTQVVFNSERELEAAATAVVAAGAELVGLSMVFTYRAREFAELAARVRRLGFRGHLVAGGHFAAFHARELLRDVAAIDSAAIGEGEELLCSLAEHLGELGAVHGLVWRDGDAIRENAPLTKQPDLDRLPLPPRKQPLDDYLGLPITNLLSSRGCGYACWFCSIVAWHALCGGDRVRMRSVEAVAEEMAGLYRQGARIFNFHDDNFVLPDKTAMLARVAALGRELERRGVREIALAIKARPDAVDEDVFGALVELGLFRVFLGIEAGTEQALRQLGRRQTVEQNQRALEIVNRLGIHTAFNLLLLNPDSTLEDLAANVEFLRRHPDNPMNFCRTEIYSGTPLEARLRRQDRLLGDYWGYDYRIADPRAQLAFEVIFPAFHSRNYGDQAVHHLAMQVDYEHQLLGHFFGTEPELARRVKRFLVTVNQNTCRHLHAAIAACGKGFGTEAARTAFEAELHAAVEADNRRLTEAGHALVSEIRAQASPTKEPEASSLRRAARAFGIAASVTLAATGCKKSADDSHPTEMIAAPPTAPRDPSDAAAPLPADAASAPTDAGAAAPPDASAAPTDAGRDAQPDAARRTYPREMVPRPPRTSHPTEEVPEFIWSPKKK